MKPKKARKSARFCFSLNEEEKRKLSVLAEAQGRSAAGVLRRIIRRAWEAKATLFAPSQEPGGYP
jgi:predicted DNA-binding protein